jgi:hypothetical protein
MASKLEQTGANAGNYLAKVGVEGSNPFARSKLPNSSSIFGPLDAATYAADDVAFL